MTRDEPVEYNVSDDYTFYIGLRLIQVLSNKLVHTAGKGYSAIDVTGPGGVPLQNATAFGDEQVPSFFVGRAKLRDSTARSSIWIQVNLRHPIPRLTVSIPNLPKP